MRPATEAHLGWRGSVVGLQGEPGLLDLVRARLPAFYSWATGPGPATSPTARIELNAAGMLDLTLPDGTRLVGAPDSEVLRAAASRLELAVVSRLTDHTVVHAGVVALDGRAVLLPGSSYAGKSTLVHALLDAGATYLSDEYAVLEDDGRVCAYPRPLALRTGVGERRRLVTTPADRTPGPTAGPLPVALVVEVRHDPAGWTVEPTTPAAATMAMLAHCVTAGADPAGTLDRLVTVTTGARSWCGTRGEAADAARRVLELLGGPGGA